MGRNAKPTALHVAEGNPNRLTREQLQARQAGEIKLGKSELEKIKPPPYVKGDVKAFMHWKQCMKEYKAAAALKIELLTSSDVDMLAMYCKTYSEYERLLISYQRIDSIAENCEPLEQYMEESEVFDTRVMKQIASLVSIEGLIRLETAINKKMDMLIKMQDRLFLNPLAKIKNVAKPKEEKPAGKFSRFGMNRGG